MRLTPAQKLKAYKQSPPKIRASNPAMAEVHERLIAALEKEVAR